MVRVSRQRRSVALLALLLAAGGCKADRPTQLVIAVATNLAIPAEIDQLALNVAQGALQRDFTFALDPAKPDALELPATLALNAGSDLTLSVLVQATARKGAQRVVERRARAKLVRERILLLRLELLRSCAARPEPCPDDETCTAAGCGPVDVGELPEFAPEEAFAPLQAGVPLDARADAAGDAGPGAEAGADGPLPDTAEDAPRPDGPPPDGPAPDLAADSAPPDANTCGDKVKNGSDECDDADFGTLSCAGLGFAKGTLKCTAQCKLDLSACDSKGFVLVGKATFNMGSALSEPCRQTNETQHWVTLSHPYEIAQHEVTQAAYENLIGSNPAFFSAAGGGPDCGADCPVEMVSWNEAAAYCNELSEGAALAKCYSCTGSGVNTRCDAVAAYAGAQIYACPGYRLPTEAEWEYAYRAGSTTDFYPSAGNTGALTYSCSSSIVDPNADKIGWCAQNANKMPHPVGLKAPNAWQLFDMAGNVWEWCHDWYLEDLGSAAVTDPVGLCPYDCVLRAGRGGSWLEGFSYMRGAGRAWGGHYSVDKYTGFRCARTRSE